MKIRIEVTQVDRAYDNYLHLVVSAGEAEPNDRYRYTCLCCHENVRIASAMQKKQVVHFRHINGNKGHLDCENYVQLLSQPSVKTSLNRNIDSVGFYYKSNTQNMYVSVKLSSEDIDNYAAAGARYEIRSAYGAVPFYSCPISPMYFSAEVATQIPITEFGSTYYVGVSSHPRNGYEIFRKDSIAILKIVGEPNDNFEAKVILSGNLYTKTAYFLLSCRDEFTRRICNSSAILVQERYKISIGKRNFTGVVFQFRKKTADLDYYLLEYNYRLYDAESLCVLWPPMRKNTDGFVSDAEKCYISSSFSLKPRSNTNADDQDIALISESLSVISLSKEIKIICKNAEMTIGVGGGNNKAVEPIIRQEIETTSFAVPLEGDYYLYSEDGVRKLSAGETLTLCDSFIIRHYDQTYIVSQYTSPTATETGIEKNISDILRNYRVLIPFEKGRYPENIHHEIIRNYLQECKESGYINLAVSRLIKEEQHD